MTFLPHFEVITCCKTIYCLKLKAILICLKFLEKYFKTNKSVNVVVSTVNVVVREQVLPLNFRLKLITCM